MRAVLRPVIVAVLGLSLALGTAACSGELPSGRSMENASATKDKPAKKAKKAKKTKKASKTPSTKVSKGEPGPSGSTKKTSNKKVPKLATRTFVGTDLGDRRTVRGSVVSLRFDAGRVTVKPGCGTLEGTATWDAEGISITGTGLKATPGSCSDALKQQDVWVQALLEAKPQFTLRGRVMTITDGFSTMTLTERT